MLCDFDDFIKTKSFVSIGFGLACHLGVLADLPTIGIGKNVSIITSSMESCVVGIKPRLTILVYLNITASRMRTLSLDFYEHFIYFLFPNFTCLGKN